MIETKQILRSPQFHDYEGIVIDQGIEIGEGIHSAINGLAVCTALKQIEEKGFILSLPEMLRERVLAPYEDPIWNQSYCTSSEEHVAETKHSTKVVVVLHGGGLITRNRILKTLYNEEWAESYGIRMESKEIQDFLDDKIVCGEEIPVYTSREILSGINVLCRKYAVVVDFEDAQKSPNGYLIEMNSLLCDHLAIARIGSRDGAADYLSHISKQENTTRYGHSHCYNNSTLEIPQGRFLELSLDAFKGIIGTEFPSTVLVTRKK